MTTIERPVKSETFKWNSYFFHVQKLFGLVQNSSFHSHQKTKFLIFVRFELVLLTLFGWLEVEDENNIHIANFHDTHLTVTEYLLPHDYLTVLAKQTLDRVAHKPWNLPELLPDSLAFSLKHFTDLRNLDSCSRLRFPAHTPMEIRVYRDEVTNQLALFLFIPWSWTWKILQTLKIHEKLLKIAQVRFFSPRWSGIEQGNPSPPQKKN